MEIHRKDLTIYASSTDIFSILISKQQFLNVSTSRKMINDLTEMSLIKEPGQDFDKSGNKVSELARKLRVMDPCHLI